MTSTVSPNILLFFVALVVSFICTPLAKRIATALGAIDYPSSRRVNASPTPRMGGIAIFAGIVVALGLQYAGSHYFGWGSIRIVAPRLQVNYQLVSCAFVVIFLVGFIDDIKGLKPLHKMGGQLIAAIIAVSGGLVIGVIVNPFNPGDVIELGWLAYPITIVYLVAYVNIINLIDGLDGLAAGISFFASGTMFILSMWAGQLSAATLAIALAGATLGFLPYNFHPASIFMGDCGSHLLGFALGSISLLSVTRVAGLTTIILPLVIAGIPILDTFSAIIRRTRAHVSVGQADKGHIHHRLLAEGFDQKQTVLLIYGWTFLLCLGSLLMTQLTLAPRIAVFVALLVGSAAFALKLRLFEPVLLHHYNPSTGKDELVGPTDEAFEQEIEAFEEEHDHLHPHFRNKGSQEQ